MRDHGLVDQLRALGGWLLAIGTVATLLWTGVASAAQRQAKHASSRPGASASRTPSRPTSKRPRTTTARRKVGPVTRATARARALPERGSRGTVDEHVHVRRGDTLESVLAARGVSPTEAYPWLVAASGVYDLRALHPRRGITLRFDRATRALEAMRYEIDDHTMLVLEANALGVSARRAELPYFIEVKGVACRIERVLREDAIEAGVPVRVVGELVDAFAWDVDVETGLRPGDEFRVLYENVWQTGLGRPEAGNVLGASVVTGGRTVTAVYFADADGRGAYYRPTGTAVTRSFLRYPVEFTEITSGFSEYRLHPILHVGRPHRGVDLAAPHGTPVRAAANGQVVHAGWLGGLGQALRIEHPNGITSVYGHLARILPNIAEGTTVARGQVIGFVGSTGLATGPHLHYELERDGRQVDPLRIAIESEAPVPAAHRRAFDRVKSEVTRHLAGLPENNRLLTVSLSPPAYAED